MSKAFIPNGTSAKSVNAETANNALKFNNMSSQVFSMYFGLISQSTSVYSNLRDYLIYLHTSGYTMGSFLCSEFPDLPSSGTGAWIYFNCDSKNSDHISVQAYEVGTKKNFVTSLHISDQQISWQKFAQTESGTWIPRLTSRSDDRSAILESYRADYTKIGQLIFVRVAFALSSKGTLLDTDAIYMNGLPFSCNAYASLTPSWWYGARLPNGWGGETSGAGINLYKPIDSGVTNIKASDIDDNFKVEDLSGCYMTN